MKYPTINPLNSAHRFATQLQMKKLSPRIIAGIFGLLATAVVFLWFVFGWLNITTSLLDVFGVEGLRIPAGIAIGGLLTAAVGFNKF